MEYRRKRRRGRGYKRARGAAVKLNAKAVRAVVFLLLAAVIIYLLCGTSIGTFISERVLAPLFAKIAQPTPKSDVLTDPTPTPSTPIATVLTASGSTEVTLPAINLYMLQMGVFSSRENAEDVIASLKSLGAAGYAYEDNGNIRVIAAAYVDEASAKSVRDRLTSEGYSCTVYSISTRGAELLITASEERLLPIETAFTLAYDSVSGLSEAVIDFDAACRTVEYELVILAEMQTNARNAAGAIETPAQSNALLMCVYDYYVGVAAVLSKVQQSITDRTEFSSSLKNAMIEVSLLYVDMLNRIGG